MIEDDYYSWSHKNAIIDKYEIVFDEIVVDTKSNGKEITVECALVLKNAVSDSYQFGCSNFKPVFLGLCFAALYVIKV